VQPPGPPSTRVRRLAAVLGGLLAALALALGTPPTTPAGAEHVTPTCPTGVDTDPEGWVCMVLNYNAGPGPALAAVTTRVDQLAASGRAAVTEAIVFSDASLAREIATVYQDDLGRSPEAGGTSYWTGVIRAQRSELPFELGVFGSPEYQSRFASFQASLIPVYERFLGRSPETAGLSFWTLELTSGRMSAGAIYGAIATSTEAGALRSTRLYGHYLLRTPDAGGHAYWTDQADDAGLLRITAAFATTDEAFVKLAARGRCLAGDPAVCPPPTTTTAPTTSTTAPTTPPTAPTTSTTGP